MGARAMRGARGSLAMVGSDFRWFHDGAETAGPAGGTGTLMVRALQRGNERPIPGALVRINGVEIGRTSSMGSLYYVASLAAALTVDVTADGYVGFGADGAITTAETWTFYLERKA